MIGKAGLKAGLIGGIVLAVIAAINQLWLVRIAQTFSWIVCGINLLIYLAIGVWAAALLAPPRTTGDAAKAGAIAGVLCSLLSGIVSLALTAYTLVTTGSLPGVTPEQMDLLQQSGISTGALIASSGFGMVCGLLIGIGITAIGGAIYAALKPD